MTRSRILAALAAVVIVAACPETILGPPEEAADTGVQPAVDGAVAGPDAADQSQDGGTSAADGGAQDTGLDAGTSAGDAASLPINFGAMTLSAGKGQVNQPLYAVHGTAADDVWAVGANGYVLHYDGTQWTEIYRNPGNNNYGVLAETGGAFVVGRSGLVLSCTVAGGCSDLGLGGQNLLAVVRDADRNLWAAGTTGISLISQSGGSWSASSVFPTVMPVNALALAGGELFGVGGPSGAASLRVAHRANQSWTAESTDTASGQGQLNGAWMSPDGALLAVGDKGETARRAPGGRWTFERPRETFSWLSVSGDAADRAYAVGDGGLMARWNGTSWSTFAPPVITPLYSIWAGRERSSGRAVYFAVGGSASTVILIGQ